MWKGSVFAWTWENCVHFFTFPTEDAEWWQPDIESFTTNIAPNYCRRQSYAHLRVALLNTIAQYGNIAFVIEGEKKKPLVKTHD